MAYRKGLVLTFGILNVIVSADGMKDKESSLVSVCCGPANGEHPPTKINQKLYCASCDDTVTYGDLKKASVVGDAFVVLEQQEVATVKDSALGATKKMLNVTLHPASEVASHTLQGDSVYVLTPEGSPQLGAYSLLLDTIARHEEIAFLTRWTPTSKVSPFQLKVFNGSLVMQQLCEPGNVRTAPVVDVIEALPEHQTMMDSLLPTLVTAFDPDAYNDQAGAALQALIASKEAVAGVTVEVPKGTKAPVVAGSVDLTAALSAMLSAAAPAKPVRKAAVRKAKVSA